ncbi:MAG: response regulator [Bdellovibrionales bacterium]|nr:response regulator [Bdellovibrionales bacterium]
MIIDQKFKILIAEDAPVQGKKLQYVLEKLGYDVVWALDGILALEELNKHQFSLIISDYQMPNLDGLEFLKCVRIDPRSQNIPFILLTTIEDEMVFLESLEAGANEFLNKPFRPEELKLRTKNLISLYKYQVLLSEDNLKLTYQIREQNVMLKNHLDELKNAYEELRNLQEQAIQNSKLTSLGLMSAGMAHEINNPLTIIMAQNKKLKRLIEMESNDRVSILKLNEQIEKSTNRINKIVMHLKEFSRHGGGDVHVNDPVNLSEVLVDLKDFYGGLVEKFEIELTEEIEAECFGLIDKTSIEQILVNLIHNAVDALDGQEIKKIWLKCYSQDEFVMVEVRDNGPGISSENVKKIFDPFFTTKEIGKGMGLGLSLVKSYLKASSGELKLESEAGRTVFKVVLRKYHEHKSKNVA